MSELVLRPIGYVRSRLIDLADAPKQGDEGAPTAVLVIDEGVAAAVRGLHVGEDVIVLTWLHRADRQALVVHPRGDLSRAETGVFATRSPARPNPIGLHRVRIEAITENRLQVSGMEAIDGTPILDLKPVLGDITER